MEGKKQSIRDKVKEGLANQLEAKKISHEFERDFIRYHAAKNTDKKERANMKLMADGQNKQMEELETKLAFLKTWE